MSQTAYGLLSTPIPGVLYDASMVIDSMSAANIDPTWNIPFGVMAARSGTDAVGAKAFQTATDEPMGIVTLEHTHDPGPNGTLVQSGVVGTAPGPGLAKNAMLSLLRKGRIYVLVENDVAVNAGTKAFCRFAQNGAGKLQLGAFRASADGAAQVSTVTPTAVNSTIYVLRVEIPDAAGVLHAFTFEFLSSGAATATNICAGFRALMAADAQFTALCTASGTTTLILTATAASAGQAFTVQAEGDGVMAVVLTTPPAATAIAVKGRFLGPAVTVPATAYPGASAGSGTASVLAAPMEFDASVF